VRGSKPIPPERVAGIVGEDLVRLRALPGVKAATSVNQIVYGNNSNNTGVTLEPDSKGLRVSAAQYTGDDQVLPTFGLKLVEGRNFTADEILDGFQAFAVSDPKVPQLIINKVMAEKLFPGQPAVGKQVYLFGRSPSTVVGVVANRFGLPPHSP